MVRMHNLNLMLNWGVLSFFYLIFHYIITIDHKQYYKKLPQSSFQHWIWILYPLIEAEIIKLLHSKLTIYGKWPLFCFFYFFKKLEIHPRGYLTYMENYLSFLVGFADYVIDKRNNSNSFFFFRIYAMGRDAQESRNTCRSTYEEIWK